MNTDGGNLYFTAGLDISELQAGAARARQSLESIGDSATSESSKIGSALRSIGTAVGGMFAVSGAKELVTQVATVRGQFQQLEMSFKTMLGSSSQADALMSQLIQTAASTPFSMTEVAQGAKQLIAYGVEADGVNDALVRLGDIAAGLSIPLNDLAYLYGTTMVQGRLYTQDLNQFLNRGIPLTDELAQQFGVTKDKVKELVAEGKVGFPEVQKAIQNLTDEGGKFGGLMAAQSQTITGQISNLQDGIEQMFNEIGKSTEGVISSSIGAVSSIVENWRGVGEALMAVVATYGTYKAAVMATAAVQNAVTTVKHTEEAQQLYAVMTAEQQARISKLGLAETSNEYYVAVKAEIEAEMERQSQLAAVTNAELTAARERLASAEQAKTAATETVAAKRSELEAAIQEAATEQTAALQKKIAIETELESRATLRATKLQEQQESLVSQARALEEAGASAEVVAAKKQEIATITQKITAAQSEAAQHSKNIAALQSEMAATVDVTNSRKVAKAQTALETAEENLNTAAKARNTAAREVSSKAASLDSTLRRANTVETAANTAAQTANASATNILTLAKNKLAAVASKLNAIIMANPWAIALASVVALGYGIYKLVTYQTDAEKAQKRLDDATKDFNKSVASEQVQIDSAFARLKAATEGTAEYEAAKRSIIKQYGSYLDGLGSEVQSLTDVEAAYRAVSAAARDSAKARAMDAFSKEAADTYASTESEQKERIYQLLRDKYGTQTGDDGIALAEKYYWEVVNSLGNNGQQVDEQLLNAFDKQHYIAGSPMTGIGAMTYTTNDLKAALEEIENARKIYDETMKEAQRRFATANPTTVGTTAGAADTTPTEAVQNKQYWENYQKEQQAMLDAMTQAELDTQRAEEIRENIRKAQEAINQYSVSKPTAGKDDTDAAAERAEKIKEYEDAVIAANAEAELNIRQKQIENMDEGFAKQQAQIQLNYDRLIAENKQREQDMIDALKDRKVLEFQQENPQATTAQTAEYRATLDVTVADLSTEQQAQLAQYAQLAEQSRIMANKEALNSMLQDVLTYEQSRLKTAEEYAKKRADLYETDDEGNVTTTLRDGVTEGNVAELDYQEQQALGAVDEQFAAREDEYKAWCNQIADLSLEQLEQVLKRAEEELAQLEQTGTEDPQQLAVARAKVQTARQQVSSAKSKADTDPDEDSETKWTDLYEVINKCKDEFENMGDTVGGVAGEIIASAGGIATSTLSMINGIVQLVNSSTSGVKTASTTASIAIQTVEKASVILAIISAAIQVAMAIANLFNDDDELQEDIEDLQAKIDELEWERNNQDAVLLEQQFGDTYAYVIEQLEKARQQLILNAKAAADYSLAFDVAGKSVVQSVTLMNAAVDELTEAYASVSYTANKLIGNGAEYASAKEQLESIAEQQLLITQQIEAEDDKKHTDYDYIDELEEQLAELAADAVEIINEMVEDIMGGTSSDIAEQLSDAFFEAFENGEDAAEAWGDTVDDIIADITKSLLIEEFLEEPLGEIFDKYKSIWFSDDGTFAGVDAVLASLTSLESDLSQVGEDWTTIWENLPDSVKDLIDSTASESERDTSTGGIAEASQESVDELNGRATAIQSHTYSISENTKTLLATAQSILSSVLQIETNTTGMIKKLGEMEIDIGEMQQDISTLVVKGIYIR